MKNGAGTQAKTLLTYIAKCRYCGRPLKRSILRHKGRKDAAKYFCGFRGCYKVTISGALNLETLTKVEQALRPQIAQAEKALVPPISDRRVRALVSADDLREAWRALPLAEQRTIIKAGFDIRIQQTRNRGQNHFEPKRVLIELRAL